MRSIFKILGLALLTALPAFCQQVNPTTQIRWGAAPGCGASGYVYSPASSACILAAATNNGWQYSLSVSQGVSDTTATMNASLGMPSAGTFFIGGEYESYSSINYTTNVLSGIVRGLYLTTPTTHSSGALASSVNQAFQGTGRAPWGGVFYGTTLSLNNGFPASGQPLTINSGGNEFDVLTDGTIAQQNSSATNYLSPIQIGVPNAHNDGTNYVLPINNTSQVVQDNAPHELTSPIGDSAGYAGVLAAIPAPNVRAPALIAQFIGAGSCNITYVVTGVDADGVEVPGTAATISNLAPWTSPGSVKIRYPSAAGVISYNAYRTVVSAGCTGLATGKFVTGITGNYGEISDAYTGGDSTTPPASNSSLAKSCVGTAATPELYCTTAGASSTENFTCSTSTRGWTYHNTAATVSPFAYVCNGTSFVTAY